MTVWEAILLGIIQGLTEFLPISSTAHLLVTRQLLGHDDPRDAFTTAIQLGTLAAVLVYFRHDIVRLVRAFLGDLFALRYGTSTDSRLCWKIAVGTLPVVICGFTLRKLIKEHLYTLEVMAGAAIVFALLLLEAEHVWRNRKRQGDEGRNEEGITWRDALFIGCFQALALIPGASRSGCTITAALLIGLSRSTSARFSFLLSLPSILGAGLYEMYKDRTALFSSNENAVNLGVGTVTAAIVGYGAIAWLLHYLKTNTTLVFIIYRLVLGVTILGLVLGNVVK